MLKRYLKKFIGYVGVYEVYKMHFIWEQKVWRYRYYKNRNKKRIPLTDEQLRGFHNDCDMFMKDFFPLIWTLMRSKCHSV